MNGERKTINRLNGKISVVLRYFGEVAADILCPKKCIVCGCLVPLGRKESICCDCMSSIGKNSAVVIEPDSYFEEVIGAVPYEGNIRKSMIRFKFNSRRYLYSAFGYCIYSLIKDREFLKDYHIICPVPIHPLRSREYNQSSLIAKYIADRLGLKLCDDMLLKVKNISPLSSMGYSLRRSSVLGVFDFNLKYDIFGKNIILLDDIFTTGSTANECAKILRMYGAANVIVLAACHGEQKGDNGHGDATDLGY